MTKRSIQALALALTVALAATPGAAAAGAAAAGTAGHAPASPRVVGFRLAGDMIAVPLPAGYCLPTPKYADILQVQAAMDSQNLTLLGLYDCAEMASGARATHFALIKAPRRALGQRITRQELLAGMGAVPDSELSRALQGVGPGVEKDASSVVGRDVAVQSSLVPAARDANAFYLAGGIQVSAGDIAQSGAVAVAMTSVKGHVMAYDFYGPGVGVADVARVLSRAKGEVARLVAAN